MALSLTQHYTDTDWLLSEHGETVTIQRLTISYDTIPPTETWTASGAVLMEIQPISGTMARHDAGILVEATHWAMADYNSGILTNDRIIRTGETDYYLAIRVDNCDDHLEVWLKKAEGAV